MTGILKRGENTYRFTVSVGFNGYGKQVRKTTTFKVPEGTSRTKAEKMIKAAYVDFSNQCQGMKNLNENMRFKELVEIYLKEYAANELKPASAYNYRKDLSLHMLPMFGNKKIKDISVSDMSSFFTQLNMAPASTKKMKTITSSVFHFGIRQGYIKRNPCQGALYKKDTIHNDKMNFYNKFQCRQLVQLTSEYSKLNVIIQFLLFTGMRCGECLALSWHDVDFHYNTIKISKTLTYADHKWFLTSPKTKNSYRTIKMSDYVKQLLLNHKEQQDKDKKIVGKAWEHIETVFTSATGNYYDRNLLNKQFKRFLEKHDMPLITVHGLRHTNASLMIDSGVGIKAVSSHLGHCNISITGDIYSHVFQEYEAKIADVVEQSLI